MAAAIDKAWRQGLTRIELTVRADNPNARTLYERLGFQHEGVQRQAFRVDGQFIDSHAMALLRRAA
jgi:putative acetyltransferase